MSKSLDSPVKILLADDSVTMHRAVSLALKKESYELVCVDNGKDALRLAYELRPQIILLDLDMPEKTGIEVAQEIRSDATLAGTQIVLLCGSFDEINEKDIEKAPVDARLWKPFESHVLLAMLRTLLSARTPVSFAAPAVAAESTAPQATRPASVLPPAAPTHKASPPPVSKVQTPKSRKEEAIELASSELEDRFEQLPHESTEKRQIQEAVEATRPLSVSDLFDPSKFRKKMAGATSLENLHVKPSAAKASPKNFPSPLKRSKKPLLHLRAAHHHLPPPQGRHLNQLRLPRKIPS